MKLHELYESAKKYGDVYTKDEFENLPDVSAYNIEEAYKIGKTIFDNKFGLGQVPDGANVVYMGFAIEIKPSDFISMVKPGDREKDASNLLEKMKKLTPIGTPFLEVKTNLEDWKEEAAPLKVKISGHEGRARTMAFRQLNGNIPFFVHVFPRGGYRSKHFSKQFFDELRKIGLIHEDDSMDSAPRKIEIGRIFCNGSVF